MIEAIVFDLDGTLLYTLEDIRTVVNKVLNVNGMPDKTIDEIKNAVGRGVEELARKVIPSNSLTDETLNSVSDQIRATYLEHDFRKTKPYPGIKELLNMLQAKNMPMAVLTNKPQKSAEKAIQEYFGEFSFVSVQGVRKGYDTKPSKEAVVPVLRKLGSIPGNTLMIGDSDIDMDTARNAGMISVGVTWGFRDVSLLLDHGAHYTVDNPGEIMGIPGIK